MVWFADLPVDVQRAAVRATAMQTYPSAWPSAPRAGAAHRIRPKGTDPGEAPTGIEPVYTALQAAA